jgi:LuxR family maltose regulon positive regulatory protein
MLSGGRGPEALFNALAASMLDMQPPDLRDFLLASSTLFKMTPERCSTILELSDSTYWFQEAQRRNLFLSRIGGRLVYHRLFRDFLQNQLSQNNPHLFVSLHVKAARWFEENDLLEDSFDHYLAAGLVERAAGIAERVADAYFIQGHFETLLVWRAKLGRMTAFAPKLLLNCARVHTDRYEYDDAEIALDEAQRVFEETNYEAGVTDVCLQSAFIKLQKGETRRAITEAMRFVSSAGVASRSRGRALNILGVAHLRLGEIKIAIAYLEQALELHRYDGDTHALANVLQDLGVAYLRQGRLNDASACLQEVVALRRSLGSPGTVAAALNNLGYYYHLDGNYDQAVATFQEGLSIVARVPNKRVESALLWSMGDVRRDQGAFEEALRLYNRSLGLIGSSEPWLRSAVLVSSATLRRWQGKIQESALLAERALSLANAHQIALQGVSARAALWAARARLNEGSLAGENLDTVLDELRGQDARLKLIWALALSAHTALLCGDRQGADSYLGIALGEAQQGGSAQPLVAEIAHSPLLEAHIASQPARYADLIWSLKKLQGVQENQHQPLRAVRVVLPETYSLRVMTLGYERIERDGEPVSATEWRSSAAREIFLYLLFNGPDSREQISLFFWPDSPSSQVRSNFHTTLYRARQALGERVIMFQDGLYLIDPDLDLWCDARELENLAGQARLMPPRDARTEELWRKAVALYHGDFLPSMDADWVAYRRESLLETYLEALNGLGNCARVRHDSREALRAYQRVLEIDPYREDTHRAIMMCYAELGEKQQILAQFRRLQTLLRDELGLGPSVETSSLANSLLK